MQNPDLNGAGAGDEATQADAQLERFGFGIAIFGPDGRIDRYNSAFARCVEGRGCSLKPGLAADAIYTRVAGGATSAPAGSPRFGQVEQWRVAGGREVTVLCADISGGGRICSLPGSEPDEAHASQGQGSDAEAEAVGHRLTGFLARLGHELRNPLSGILGIASLLERSGLDEKQRAHVEVIRESGNLLLRLVGDLMDLSRLERQDFQLMPESIDLVHLIESCTDLAQSSAREKGLALRMATPSITLPKVMADPTRLKQVAMNLITNAVKYTEEGEVIVMLEARHEVDALNCNLVVRDTGIGIDEEDLGVIFDEFRQIRGNARRVEGLGLGLPICRRLVEEMGGEIGLRSTPGQGTEARVTLALPLAD